MATKKEIPFFDKTIVTVFTITKVLTILSIIGIFYAYSDLHSINLWNRWYTDKSILDALYIPFSNWDAQHYLVLADWGYGFQERSLPFFPLYPTLIRLLNFILPNIYLSAFIVTLVSAYCFTVYFYRIATHYLTKKLATLAFVCVMTFPTAFFLTVFYSEALFLALFMGFLYYYDVKKSYHALWFALLMPLARAQSVFLLAGIVIICAIKLVNGLRSQNTSKKTSKNTSKKSLKSTVVTIKNSLILEGNIIAAFLSGILIYLLFFLYSTGSMLAGINAQELFNFQNNITNLFNPIHLFHYLITPSKAMFGYTYALVDKLFMLVALFITVLVIRTKNITWVVFYMMLIYPVASMGAGGSFSRFSLIALPIAVISLLINLNKHKPIQKILPILIMIPFIVIQLYFIFRFSVNAWVG